jgi:predicted ATPase with chaperone activity
MMNSVTMAGIAPHLPKMVAIDDVPAPAAPANTAETGLDTQFVHELAIKTAATVSQFTSEWAARKLHLPQQLLSDVLEQLRVERLLEVLGQAGPFGYRYAITQRGRDAAARLLEISGYVGPAPVSLAAYTAMIEWQLAQVPSPTVEQVAEATAQMVLTDEARLTAALAASSGRSLFVFGPAGNGKTTLGRQLHDTLSGDIWIPHCINIDSSIIRIFDSQVHQEVDSFAGATGWQIDQRWVRIRRPMIVAGGEMTLDSCDLIYSRSLRFYEAPLHVKANGGLFLIDDFGRQRVEPRDLLNRWIIPLEHQIDFMTLHTGQKVQIPFRLLLIIATNLKPEDVTDPAFLRRMGYRLLLDKPSPEQYSEIFRRYAARWDATVSPQALAHLLGRYQAEGCELRGCEPRDLIDRARDICRLRGQPLVLNEAILDLAWAGYFGNSTKTYNSATTRPV